MLFMFLKHNSPNEASKLFLHHPSDAGWMPEGRDGGRDLGNALGSGEPQHCWQFFSAHRAQVRI